MTDSETKPPTEDETKPPTEDETKPLTEDETKPPTEDETKPLTEDETKLPTENETKPLTEDETKPPTEDGTKPPTEDAPKPPTEDGANTNKTTMQKEDGLGTTVASHYNKLEEIGIEVRKESRIFHMRGFNNWVKSVLFNEFVDRLRQKNRSRPLKILDLASGKGGDLKKWKIANAAKVVMADIAATSISQAEERYKSMLATQHPRHRLFEAEFIAADCTKSRLKDTYKEPDVEFDICSCQFAYHYSFESEAQADMMLQNACENLRDGAFFVGTTPDAREIVRRLRASEDKKSFGNEVYRVTFADTAHTDACLNPPDPSSDETKDRPSPPEFGLKYNFHLEGCVDCPEFLVDFSVLGRLAAKHNMICVCKRNFGVFYQDKIKSNARLIHRMSALEEYPAPNEKQLSSPNPESYRQAQNKLEELRKSGSHVSSVKTISKEEWEAITLYLVFAFQKVSPEVAQSLNSARKPGPLDQNLGDPIPPPAIVERLAPRRPLPDRRHEPDSKYPRYEGQNRHHRGHGRDHDNQHDRRRDDHRGDNNRRDNFRGDSRNSH